MPKKAALKKSDVPYIIARIVASELTRRGQPVIRRTVNNFGSRAAEMMGTKFNEENRRVSRFIRTWGAEHVSGMINRTTQMRVQKVLLDGIRDGKDYEQMGKVIGHVFDVAEGSRATMIARTEIHRASNFASMEGYRQAGVDQKEWQHTDGGPDARPDHIAMDGQVVGIDEDFESPSGNTAPYPGQFGDAADDANCQCGVLPVVDDKRLRPRARRLLVKTTPRLRVPFEREMRRAMRAGFRVQRNAVMDEFNARADKDAGAEAA